jgi:hypothetical protein
MEFNYFLFIPLFSDKKVKNIGKDFSPNAMMLSTCMMKLVLLVRKYLILASLRVQSTK